MGLIEIYRVTADMYAADPDFVTDTAEGLLVAQNAAGLIEAADGTVRAIGVAGDTQSNSTAGTPLAANVVINSAGATRSTQNRVSDFFDETLASGLVTVYHSGGKFATDQYDTTVNYAFGDALYSTAAGLFTNDASANNQIVGTVTGTPDDYPSGVPGTDVAGSISLGVYLVFKLEI
ncbi:MAG: hypothetical protein WDA06_05290 [Phenylobacterium sp.]